MKIVVENSTTPNIEQVLIWHDFCSNLNEHMLSLEDSDELTEAKYKLREEILNLYLVENRKYLKSEYREYRLSNLMKKEKE